jgi:membrane peptidoglycan carboxypeptidase
VRGGMHDVIMSKRGTGRKAAVKGLTFAGKTGTAEYWVTINGKRKTKKNTWMIAFAPFDNPQYAIAFLIEDGNSGGSTVGPRLKVLMEGLFLKMKREGRVGIRSQERGVRGQGRNAQRSILNAQFSMLNSNFQVSGFIPHPSLTSLGGAS